MPGCSLAFLSSDNRPHVLRDNPFNSTHIGHSYESVQVPITAAEILLKALESKIFAEPSTEAEEIAYSFFRTLNPDMTGFALVMLDS